MQAGERDGVDPRTLRALAHPARLRILYELHARGSARAADLASVLAVPANHVSHHIHLLAKYRLVEEAPQQGQDRRERYWRLTDLGMQTGAMRHPDLEPGGAAAVAFWRRRTLSRISWILEQAEAVQASGGEPGPDATINDVPMLLTRNEAETMADELFALLSSWAERGRQAAREAPSADRSTFAVLTFIGLDSPTDG